MKICVTAHRPNKLYGYDLSDKRYETLKQLFKQLLIKYNCTEAITGMALGGDTIFALAVLELKNEGYNIKLHCAVPFKHYSIKWNDKDRTLYKSILHAADTVKLVSDDEYKAWLLQKRNEYMVDLSDLIIAIWDGSPSGTANCINYAKKYYKPIIYINPNNVKINE